MSACAVLLSACGKKGPPLAPFVHIPAAVDKITAERVGSDVYVKVTVPAQNIDASKPADVSRIDVYGFTGTTPPARGQFLVQAERLAVIPVAPAPRPGEPPPPPATQLSGALQGSEVTVRDGLTADQLVPKPPPPPLESERRRPPPVPAVTPTREPVPQGPPMPRRFYMAIAFSDRARSSAQGAVADVPLSVLPAAPDQLRVEYTSAMVQLSWEPSAGVLGFVLDRALPIEEAPFDPVPSSSQQPTPMASDVPAGPTRYNVYRSESADPLALPEPAVAAAWSSPRPTPLNPMPLTTLQLADAAVFERVQCYVVRAVRGAGTALVEGDATPMECVTPIDTFPPAAPANLTAVAGEGTISLIWEPNAEVDLGGYLVLRGEAGSATLQSLTATAIPDARYTDRDVKPGTRYVYAVVAVDDRVPLPNVSAASTRVEETAR